MNNTFSLDDLFTFTNAQLVWISKSLGIPCYAECIDSNSTKTIYKLNNIPRRIICERLLDYLSDTQTHKTPLIINECHYAPYMPRIHITFDLDKKVLINRFSLDDWNCRAFLRKCGILSPSYEKLNEFVHTQWIKNTKPFTYRDLQIMFVEYISNKYHITVPTHNDLNIPNTSKYTIANACTKILTHSYIPTVKLILDNLPKSYSLITNTDNIDKQPNDTIIESSGLSPASAYAT